MLLLLLFGQQCSPHNWMIGSESKRLRADLRAISSRHHDFTPFGVWMYCVLLCIWFEVVKIVCVRFVLWRAKWGPIEELKGGLEEIIWYEHLFALNLCLFPAPGPSLIPSSPFGLLFHAAEHVHGFIWLTCNGFEWLKGNIEQWERWGRGAERGVLVYMAQLAIWDSTDCWRPICACASLSAR